jgi:hypothetical protein
MTTVAGAALGDDEGAHSPLPPAAVALAGSTLLGARTERYSIDVLRYDEPEAWRSWRSYDYGGVPNATSWWINSIGEITQQTVVAPKMARSAARTPVRGYPPVSNKADAASTLNRHHETVVAPKVARSAAKNPVRGYPPVSNKADAASAPSRQDSAQAVAVMFAGDWGQANFSLGRRLRWAKLRGYRILARGYHRRPSPTARIYSRLGLIVQLSHSPQSLTAVAAFLAGREREAVHHEWHTHLSALTDQGLSSRDQTRAALGFLWAALRYRLRDAGNLACGPVDALLRSRTLSNLLVLIPTLMAALYILRHLGTLGVLTSAEGISVIGGTLYALVRAGRWWRNVKPPEPKVRRVKEQ